MVAHDALSIGIKSGVIGFVVRPISYLVALSPSLVAWVSISSSLKQSAALSTAFT